MSAFRGVGQSAQREIWLPYILGVSNRNLQVILFSESVLVRHFFGQVVLLFQQIILAYLDHTPPFRALVPDCDTIVLSVVALPKTYCTHRDLLSLLLTIRSICTQGWICPEYGQNKDPGPAMCSQVHFPAHMGVKNPKLSGVQLPPWNSG